MEIPHVQASVVLLVDGTSKVVLARKKQPIHHEGGSISYSLGLYNGYGGKKEETDGDIFDTAVRELFDESGVEAKKEDLDLKILVYFYLQKGGSEVVPYMSVSFFLLYTWQGIPCEGKEMGAPVFFEKDNLPYDEMMPADRVLCNLIFQDKKGIYQVILKGRDVKPEIILVSEEF